jgi:hypothetical protein
MNCYSQSNSNFFPIWTYHQDNINIHGISIGFLTTGYGHEGGFRNTNTNGVKIELIGIGLGFPFTLNYPPISISEEQNNYKKFSEHINGISISLFGTFCDCQTNGISIGSIGQYNELLNGISFSLINYAERHNGIQIGGVLNISSTSNGLQFGIYNNSFKTNGIQLGIINKSHNLDGLQIGLWNTNQNGSYPLMNFNF